MKLTLLGTGTPRPSTKRQATANLVQIGGEILLFDAGRGASTQLAAVGLLPRDLDYIFITHHHFDHISDLGDLLLSAWNDGRTAPLRVFGPHGTKDIVETLFTQIYARDIAFRLKEAEVLENYPLPDIRDLVQVTDIPASAGHKSKNWQVRAYAVEHGHALGMTQEEWPCFGYRIEAERKVLAISGDTIDCEGVRSLAQNADLLLQCCYLTEAEIDTADKRTLSNHVLASAPQAAAIAKAANVGKMVLTHLAQKSDAMLKQVLTEARQGHKCEVVIGEDLMSFTI